VGLTGWMIAASAFGVKPGAGDATSAGGGRQGDQAVDGGQDRVAVDSQVNLAVAVDAQQQGVRGAAHS